MTHARLYVSQVMHRRFPPVAYVFRYRVLHLWVDIDHLDTLARQLRWFSIDRFNLFSLRTRDHGRRDGTPWRPWIEARLREHGIELEGGSISLLAIPRILGYAFNPLSVWYCQHADGQLRAILLEVRNTFGEHHHYLLHAQGAPLPTPVCGEKPKCLHVSPFMDMDLRYTFRLSAPGARLRIDIQEWAGEQRLLVAQQHGHALECTDRHLLRRFLSMPLAAAKVMLLIHWQAWKIWRNGGRFHRKPSPPAQEIS